MSPNQRILAYQILLSRPLGQTPSTSRPKGTPLVPASICYLILAAPLGYNILLHFPCPAYPSRLPWNLTLLFGLTSRTGGEKIPGVVAGRRGTCCLVEKLLQCPPTLGKCQFLEEMKTISVNSAGPGESTETQSSGTSIQMSPIHISESQVFKPVTRASCDTTLTKSYVYSSAIGHEGLFVSYQIVTYLLTFHEPSQLVNPLQAINTT